MSDTQQENSTNDITETKEIENERKRLYDAVVWRLERGMYVQLPTVGRKFCIHIKDDGKCPYEKTCTFMHTNFQFCPYQFSECKFGKKCKNLHFSSDQIKNMQDIQEKNNLSKKTKILNVLDRNILKIKFEPRKKKSSVDKQKKKNYTQYNLSENRFSILTDLDDCE